MRKAYSKIREYVPLYSVIVLVLTIISVILFAIVVNSTGFADFFNYYLSAPTRAFMTWLTVFFPFSVAEVVLFASPLLLILLIFLAVKFAKRGKKASIKFLTVLLSIPCLLFITFVWTYSSGYHMTKIEDKMGLDRESIEKEEIYEKEISLVSGCSNRSVPCGSNSLHLLLFSPRKDPLGRRR